MAALTGIQPINNYATPATDALRVQALLDLLPDLDSASSSGAQAVPGNPNSNSYLDEMSPAACAQLRVELAALKAAVS